ncbi:MAG TPA: hypothetical protein VGO75_00450 [Gemmatimonadaceae bacterium]|nr:hypothetical protein [Gemmatimonadaceae bacterium]
MPAILSVLVLASCTDSAVSSLTAPVTAAAQQSGASGHGSQNDANALELRAAWWKKNLKNEVRVSRKIDALGGIISIPETGLTIVFPAGAVAAPTTITITADRKYVAYKMEPAGTTFLKDVIVTQLLVGTEFGLRPLRTELFAAYIADDRLKLSGKVPVLELEPTHTIFSLLNPLIPEAQVWIIRHFSRYMLASG